MTARPAEPAVTTSGAGPFFGVTAAMPRRYPPLYREPTFLSSDPWGTDALHTTAGLIAKRMMDQNLLPPSVVMSPKGLEMFRNELRFMLKDIAPSTPYDLSVAEILKLEELCAKKLAQPKD